MLFKEDPATILSQTDPNHSLIFLTAAFFFGFIKV